MRFSLQTLGPIWSVSLWYFLAARPSSPDLRAISIQYVLRVVYHERMQEIWGSNNVAATVPELPSRERNESDVSADSDRGTAELMSLVAAAKGLLQRTRVLSKRLNSLCALHPQLMWELAEGRRLRQEAEEAGGGIEEEPLEFPDPFELGTLEVLSLNDT